MKTLKKYLFLIILLSGITMIANAQNSSEWHMLLNNDHSPFLIKMLNNEMTFTFSAQKDTLSFFHGNKKPMKPGTVIEVTLKNNSKVIYTSDDKSLNSDKTIINVPISEVKAGLSGVKIPSKPKYVMTIKEKTTERGKITFELAD